MPRFVVVCTRNYNVYGSFEFEAEAILWAKSNLAFATWVVRDVVSV